MAKSERWPDFRLCCGLCTLRHHHLAAHSFFSSPHTALSRCTGYPDSVVWQLANRLPDYLPDRISISSCCCLCISFSFSFSLQLQRLLLIGCLLVGLVSGQDYQDYQPSAPRPAPLRLHSQAQEETARPTPVPILKQINKCVGRLLYFLIILLNVSRLPLAQTQRGWFLHLRI